MSKSAQIVCNMTTNLFVIANDIKTNLIKKTSFNILGILNLQLYCSFNMNSVFLVNRLAIIVVVLTVCYSILQPLLVGCTGNKDTARMPYNFTNSAASIQDDELTAAQSIEGDRPLPQDYTDPSQSLSASSINNQKEPTGKELLGRDTWTFLHRLAGMYPPKPSLKYQRDMEDLLFLISRVYPCEVCATGMKRFLKQYPPKVKPRKYFICINAFVCFVDGFSGRLW